MGLPGYPPMGPILGPPGASSGTPFTPAGHLAAFQPKVRLVMSLSLTFTLLLIHRLLFKFTVKPTC